MGEWLCWSYHAMVAARPKGVSVVHHSTTAVDIAPGGFGREIVHLADGGAIQADHVILTTGHTPDALPGDGTPTALLPYP